MRFSRRNIVIAIIVASVAILVIYRIVSGLNKNKDIAKNVAQASVIRIDTVKKRDFVDAVNISGTIRPKLEAEIFPKISGRIVAIKHDVGDKVRAGEVLAVIEHQEISWQEKSARASLALAKAQEDNAKIDLDRANDLAKEKAITEVELEGYQLKYKSTHAQRLSAEASADIATQRLKDSSVSSIIGGVVTRRAADIGSSVSPGFSIFTVQDLSELRLVTTVDAQTLVRLKKGSIAALKIDKPSITVRGKVITLSPSLDAHSRRATVEIEVIDKTHTLVPNMFIDGTLELNRTSGVLCVPNKAIINLGGKMSVYRVLDGKVHLVHPKLGQTDGDNTIVLDGLHDGDVVSTSGLDRLHDGDAVTIEETAH